MSSIQVLLPLAVILVGAKLAELASQRAGLPGVFGTLVVGLALGPSLLGWITPNDTLRLVGEVGVILLMFLAGLETDTNEMRRVGTSALLAATGGVVLPFLGGMGLARLFGLDWAPSLFLGALLTATSVSISARVLQELGRLRTREGTTILGAAIIDDVLGLVVLSVVVGLTGGTDVVWPLVKMALFFVVALGGGRYLVPHLSNWLKNQPAREVGLAVVVGLALAYAWAAESLGGVAAITGAYLAGLIVGRTDIHSWVHEGAGSLGYGFFIPVFFVVIGLDVHAQHLTAAPMFILLLLSVAVMGKVLGCALGARMGGFTAVESLRVGVGMIARGEVALVVATLGLQAGLIDQTMFATSIVMALVTTLITPLLLKLAYAQRPELTPHNTAVQYPQVVRIGYLTPARRYGLGWR